MAIPERDPKTSGEKWFTVIFLAAFLGMIGAELLEDYSPKKLSVIFVTLWFVILLPVHELGHAAAARLCSWGLRGIVIGSGGERARIRCLGTWMSIRTWPVSGYVVPRIQGLRAAKWKNAFIYSAGPGVEILLAGIVWLVCGRGYLSPSLSVGMIAAQSLGIAVLIDLVLNLIPRSIESTTGSGEYIWNDGLGIIQSLRLTEADYARMKQQAEWQEAADGNRPESGAD